MTVRKINQSITCQACLLVLIMLSTLGGAGQADLLVGTRLGNDRAEQAINHFISQPSQVAGSLPAADDRDVNNQRASGKDTVRRYRESHRILILGGPEALSM
jgi:hypothetical protein